MALERFIKKRQPQQQKNAIYKLIEAKDSDRLKCVMDKPEFYQLPKRIIFRIIQICTNDYDPVFRNEICDFLITNPRYLEFARKHVKDFPL